MVDLEELYRLTQENNAMLKEIVEYVRNVQSGSYLSNDYAREIAFNVIGNIIAENLSDDVVENVKSQFWMK